MIIRRLTEADAAPFWVLRLRALREHPDAFGASYAQALMQSADTAAARLRHDPDVPNNFVLGAFDPDLYGMVGFYQTSGLKVRHKGSIWGMYVAAEATGRGTGRALMERAIAEVRQCPDIEQIMLTV